MSPRHDVHDIVIRPAQAIDALTIGTLWEKLVTYHHDLDDQLPVAAANGGQRYARRIEDHLEDSHTHIVVAEANGEIIGFILGVIVDMAPEMFEQTVAGFLADVFVEEAYRGQGIGRKLVQALSDWFRARGITHIELYVAARNHTGREFWDALGGRDVMVRMRLDI